MSATPWTAACQASPSIASSQSLLKLMSIELVMPSNHLILCRPLLLRPQSSQHQGLFKWVSSCVRWPKYWSFTFNISPSNEHSGLIYFRMNWLDLLAVQGTLKSLLHLLNPKYLYPIHMGLSSTFLLLEGLRESPCFIFSGSCQNPYHFMIFPSSLDVGYIIPSSGMDRVGHDWSDLAAAAAAVGWRRQCTPLQYSCLENPMDGGGWWVAIYGVAQSRTRLKWLSSRSSGNSLASAAGGLGFISGQETKILQAAGCNQKSRTKT